MNLLSLASNVTSTVTRRIEEPLTDVRAAARVLGDPRTPILLALSKGFVEPMYRAAFLSTAVSTGVLKWLSVRPCDLESIADKLGVTDRADKARLKAWLDMGIRLGDLKKREGCYRINSLAARAFAQAGNDALVAALEEVLRFHLPALLNAPRMLRDGERFSLGDQDGAVIARSTRVVEPLVQEALERNLDREAPMTLLEVGCGTGTYVRHAARMNPRLTALAVDMQAEVAEQAAKNMAEWRLDERVETRHADLRTLDVQPQFDLVTLHNSIYYFAEDERVAALERARACLAPGGRILLTTPCQGGNVGLEALNLWFTFADFGGPLPREDELVAQLKQAGFTDVSATQLIPGEQFRAFTGRSTQPAKH